MEVSLVFLGEDLHEAQSHDVASNIHACKCND